jgi:peptide/nickel transport system substrate-binding protein
MIFRNGLLAAGVVLAACAPQTPAGSQPGQTAATTAPPPVQRTLVVIGRGEPPNIAAKSIVTYSGSLGQTRRLFNATLDYVDERETPVPYLAEAIPQLDTDTWRVFPDGRMETTYRLRPNLTWHDGTTLSADDFVFGVRVYQTPEFGVASSPVLAPMAEVTAPDPATVVIHWRRPFPDAAGLDVEFQALPRHLLQQPFQQLDPQAFAGLPFWTSEYVGLGPYQIERWEPGAFVEGPAFTGHALGRPRIDRLRLVFIGDPNTVLANLLSGEAHYVSESIFYTEEGAMLEGQWAGNQGGTVLYSPVTFRITQIQARADVASPRALLDVRVRRALAHGVDAAAAFEASTAGKGLLMVCLTPPTKAYYPAVDRAIAKYPFDPRSTGRLLEEAGFVKGTDGFYGTTGGESLRVPVAADGGSVFERENAILVDSLRRAGVDAISHIVPVAQLGDNQARALLPALSTGGLGTPRYDKFSIASVARPENRWQGANRSGWANSEWDQLYQLSIRTLDPAERVAQIVQMEKIFTEEVAAIPHYFTPAATAHVAALEGPVTAFTPDAGRGILRVWDWHWRS